MEITNIDTITSSLPNPSSIPNPVRPPHQPHPVLRLVASPPDWLAGEAVASTTVPVPLATSTSSVLAKVLKRNCASQRVSGDAIASLFRLLVSCVSLFASLVPPALIHCRRAGYSLDLRDCLTPYILSCPAAGQRH